MPPDSRSVSFIFHRDTIDENVNNYGKENKKACKNFRQRLQDKFDKEMVKNKNEEKNKSTEKPDLSFGETSTDSKKTLRNGADKISKAFNSLKVTIGSLSQKLKSTTRRRQRLEESPSCSAYKQTPQSRSRNLLGRTPTKLYSPFGIESPKNAWDKEIDSSPASIISKDNENKHKFFNFSKINSFCTLR